MKLERIKHNNNDNNNNIFGRNGTFVIHHSNINERMEHNFEWK